MTSLADYVTGIQLQKRYRTEFESLLYLRLNHGKKLSVRAFC